MTVSEKPSKKRGEVPGLPGTFLLLRQTFGLYFSNFRFFFGYVAWLLIPIVISVFARVTLDAETVEIIDLVFNITLYFVLSVFLTVIFIKSIPQLRNNKPITINLTRAAMILAVPYLLTSIAVGFATLGGLILFIIPGIVFSIWFAFASTIVVIEQTRIFEAMRRSRALVRGRFGSVLWRYYAGHVVIWAAYGCLLGAILYGSFSLHGGGDIRAFLESPPGLAEDVLMRFVEMAFLPIGTIYTTLLYLHLRARE